MSKQDGRKQKRYERKRQRRHRRVPSATMRQYASDRRYCRLLQKQKKNQKRFRKIWQRNKKGEKVVLIRTERRIGQMPRRRKI